jgi:Protein of unknown function (DUF1549)
MRDHTSDTARRELVRACGCWAAEKASLLRRVTYDLTGLPPTPEDVEAFVNDTRPDAYERVVDRLLASPHHGEKWARHWLDFVRYAGTNDPRSATAAMGRVDCNQSAMPPFAVAYG